jgi:dienelactone hydrolase
MTRYFTILVLSLVAGTTLAQVKSNYIYSTSMPYGTLDLRTKITSTNYYYLQENITFSFRESSPGVRTNTYRDMTSWDSSPYTQGNLRRKNGSDKFVMNYRLLKPNNYSTSIPEGYPLIVIMHGAVERGNCYYNTCYHSNFSYDPNVNSPAAPKTIDHKLLNNDHHLLIGAKQHYDARQLAGTKSPTDPTLPARAFQGFVLMPQMMNVWDSLNVQDVIRIVRLLTEKYKIDQNRIYIHGLSIGGYSVYEAIKRAPWLFAAALPMSAVTEAANIFKHNQQSKVAHLPLWVFQGAKDGNPKSAATEAVLNKFRTAGGTPRYTKYATLGHVVWNTAYAEPDFFSWMKAKNKADLHLYKGIATIIRSKSQYPKLMLAEGFLAYQWEKNGVIISTAKANTYTVNSPGKYRARFSRLSTAPTSTQWNRWSATVTITETTSAAAIAEAELIEIDSLMGEEEEFSIEVYPNPVTSEDINITIHSSSGSQVQLEMMDLFGKSTYSAIINTDEHSNATIVNSNMPPGMYILRANDGKKVVTQKVIVQK